MSLSKTRPRTSGAGLLMLAFCVALFGCGKGKDTPPNPDEPPKDKPGEPPGEPKSEAKLTADALYKDIDKYQGKWVTVIARIPRVYTQEHPGGKTEATVNLQGENGRQDCSADFDAAEWAKVPKLEDGVRYEILGLVSGSKNTGGKLKKCRFVGVSTGEGPAPEATVTAQELVADGAKYKDKLILVKGAVGTGTPGPGGGSITVTATDDKFVICVLAAGQFEKVLKAGRGASVEVKGIVTDTGGVVTMNDCSVVKATAAGPTLKAAIFTREFAQNAAAAEKTYKDKPVTVAGKVESVADGKLVITGLSDKSKKLMPQKITAGFGPDWKDAVAKVKAGDDVTVSGMFARYSPGEVALDDCWLVK